MTKKHKKHEKHEKKKKSGKRYHLDIEFSDSEKPEAKRSIPNIKPTKRQKPTLINFVKDEERNIGIFRYIYVIMPKFIISPNNYEFKVLDKEKRTKRRQSELMKGQKGRKSGVIDLVDDDDDDPIQQDERDNDQTGMLLIVLGASRRIESVDPENNERSLKEYGVARSSKSAPPPSSSSSSSSSPSPSPSPSLSPSSSFSSSNSSFLHYEEIDRDLRTALRNEIARIMDRLLEDKALNTRKTFDSQRKLVQNNIISVVQKMINKNIFSVSDGVIKHIVHKRHHHQRELLLNSERDANWKDLEKKSMQIQDEKRERRNKTIDKLKKLKDRLINKFHTNELRPLQTDNRYHSPEVSETDSDNPNKQKIIIRNLKWRSATLRSFLRNYIDNAASNARRVRKWVYDTEYASNEDSAPVNAPKWAKVGYKGSLKHLVEKYSANREEIEDDKSQEDDDKIQEDDDKSQEDDDKSQKDDDKSQEDDDKSQEDDDATGGEKNEDQEKEQDEEVDDRKKRKKRSVSLVSEEYDNSDSSKSVG
ncbi:uncharacterized protein OCT59_017515 [Rhizophagus irregularis]|uniref:uncharacterized protein n=1 Tax=Rhizophagus irregularis TaxID=588596 RepID=UPI00332F9549|nr:hypothetical protein OCT59_017515 [Rhizophagus irregularis]